MEIDEAADNLSAVDLQEQQEQVKKEEEDTGCQPVTISVATEQESDKKDVNSAAEVSTPPTPSVVQSSITLTHDAKLIQVAGSEEQFHYISVPLSWKSLNLEDAFIMQSDAYMFVWASPSVSALKKAKATQMAQKLKVEVGCQRSVSVLEMGEEHPTFNFCLGVPKGNKLEVKKKSNDIFQVDDEDQLLEPEFFLYKIVTVDGKLSFNPVDEDLTQEMLESNSCFILDCDHEIFIWKGKSSTKAERDCCIPLAKKMLNSSDRLEGFDGPHIISVVLEGSEGALFKSKFKSGWKDKPQATFSYLSAQKKKETLSFDVESMHAEKEVVEINLGTDDGKGKLLIWNCSAKPGSKWTKVDEDDFGIFYSNKSYVCHFIYKPEGKSSIKSVIFYWEGMYANSRHYVAFKFGLYKDIQKKMQSLQSDDPVEYRISQNKEPSEFIKLFGTEILVLNEELSVKPMMFQVRGTQKTGCRGTQLPEISARHLNSMDSFVFIIPGKVILVWYGKGSNEEERFLASELYTFLPADYEAPVKEFEEGSESEGFWKLVGGKEDYPSILDLTPEDSEETEDSATDSEGKFTFKPTLKLFICTESTGIFKSEEVKPFSQLDLNHEENVILDVYNHIFLWKGSKTTESKFQLSEQLVKEYISTLPKPRSRNIRYTVVKDSEETSLFKSYFLSWKYVAPKVFIDPRDDTPKPKPPVVKLEESKPPVQEVPKEEVKVEEVPKEEIKVEEQGEPKVEEPKDEEPKVEEPKVEEPNVEEEIKEEEIKEENKNGEEESIEVTKAEEAEKPKAEEPKVEEEIKVEESESTTTNNNNNNNNNSKKSKKSKANGGHQRSDSGSPNIQVTPPIGSTLPTPSSISSSGDMLFAYSPFMSPVSSPKAARKGSHKKKNRRNNSNGGNQAVLSSSPSKSNRSIESLHLDSPSNQSPLTGSPHSQKRNKKNHNRTGSFNH